MAKKRTKEWREAEKLVTMIEKALDPNATVLHDQKLPILERYDLKGRRKPRQIDTLIVTGPPHRKTITIVEVQKRKQRVEINTFKGWLGKLEEVGAQHLVCVSHLPFPESVRDLAEAENQKVKLIQLEDATPSEIPPALFNSKLISTHRDFTSTHVDLHLTASSDNTQREDFAMQVQLHDKIFSLDETSLLSIHDLAGEHTQTSEENIGINTKTISYENKIYVLRNKEFLKVNKFVLNLAWTVSHREISPNVFTYGESETGVLAWILELKDPETGFWVKMPLIQNSNGDFLISSMLVDGKEGTKFSISVFNIVPQ